MCAPVVRCVTESPEGAVGLDVAAHDYVASIANLCRDILDGTIRPAGRLEGSTRLSGILISRADALSAKRRRH